MSDPHQNDDPGWFSTRSLIAVFIPWVGLRRAQADGVNVLVMLRQLFTAFAYALVLIGVVVVFLTSSDAGDRAVAPAVAAAGVAAYGVISLFIPRLVGAPLDCTDVGTLIVSYRTRFFLRIAFADAAALIGFVGAVLAATWWLYFLGAGFAVVGFIRLAPTQANLQRDQEDLDLAGCALSLRHVLTSATRG